jgi:lipid II:glycine glycyltransferase (peptidoglycan interpeptide bridge formation enzyme)
MISFKKKFYFWKLTDTWFRFDKGNHNLFSIRKYSFVQNHEQIKNSLCFKEISHTLTTDLTQDTETILSSISKSVLKESKKAESEGITCTFNNDLEKFIEFYNQFAGNKHLYQFNKKFISDYKDFNSVAYAMKDGEILAAHFYLVSENFKIVRSFLSGSRNVDEKFDKRTLGMANKYLKIKAILYFKDKNFKTFDYGGIVLNTDNRSLNGITEYKMSFGGKTITDISYLSPIYFFFLKIFNFLDRRYK